MWPEIETLHVVAPKSYGVRRSHQLLAKRIVTRKSGFRKYVCNIPWTISFDEDVIAHHSLDLENEITENLIKEVEQS